MKFQVTNMSSWVKKKKKSRQAQRFQTIDTNWIMQIIG